MKSLKITLIAIITIIILAISYPSFAAVNNYAYAISMGSEDMGGVQAASMAYSAYMGGGFDAHRISDPSQAQLLSVLGIRPQIFFAITHGQQNKIIFERTGLQTGNQNSTEGSRYFFGVQNYDWAGANLVILAACQAAYGENNITKQISDRMSGELVAAIGWATSIGQTAAQTWTKYFNRNVAKGNRVADAINYANSFTYDDNRIKKPVIYGSTLAKVSPVDARSIQLNKSIDNFEKDNREHIIDYDVYYNTNEDINNIYDMLKREFTDFNPDNYEIEVNGENNNIIIDCTLKLDNFSTLSGYTIFVENGKVKNVFDNTIKPCNITAIQNLNNNKITLSTKVVDFQQECKKQSAEKILSKLTNSTNTSQDTELFYDVETGKKYIIVKTTNEIDGAKAVFSDYYEIV